MKTQHPLDVLSCDLSKVVNKCVMYIYYLRQKQRYCTKISILATGQTYDVTSASKLRLSHFWRIQKITEISYKCFLLVNGSSAISPQI